MLTPTPEERAEDVMDRGHGGGSVALRAAILAAIRAAVEDDRRGRTLDSAEVEAIRLVRDMLCPTPDAYQTNRPLVDAFDRLFADRAALMARVAEYEGVMRDLALDRDEAGYAAGYAAAVAAIRRLHAVGLILDGVAVRQAVQDYLAEAVAAAVEADLAGPPPVPYTTGG